jgi:hypothetical protein
MTGLGDPDKLHVAGKIESQAQRDLFSSDSLREIFELERSLHREEKRGILLQLEPYGFVVEPFSDVACLELSS